jgi:nicotinate-nucleotide adenylyltransferase
MKLGLFGGTFDPIHLGHLILAESCREALGLDRVWFVVTATPPHKQGDRTSIAHRLEMARIAVAGNPAFEVSEIEAKTPGPHYSYQTLERLREERPGDDLYFLIGADSLADLPGWREPGRILSAATVVVVNRPGIDAALLEDPSVALAPLIAQTPRARPVLAVEVPPIGISSTELRRARGEGKSIRYRVPRGVEAYIEAQGLYQG